MRNYFAIAFTIVYLTLTVGVAKTTHYCMGREKNSTVFSFSTEKCVCSLVSEEPMSCCNDKHDLIQIQDDHSAGYVTSLTVPQFNLIGDLFAAQSALDELADSGSQIPDDNNLPPPKIPLYHSHCSLVFYDHIG